MKRVYFKKKKQLKLSTYLGVILLLVVFLTGKLFFYFQNTISPKIVNVADMSVYKFLNKFIADFKVNANIEDHYENLYKVEKNSQNEILMVDFDLKKTYQFGETLTKSLEDALKNLEMGNTNIDYYDQMISNGKDGFYLTLPIGLASDFVYFQNLGPKIPLKVNFLGSIFTNIRTKVTNYGMNNALLEIYLEVDVQYELVIPSNMERKSIHYDTLIAAKVINGRVPEFYGGVLESKSSIATSSFK